MKIEAKAETAKTDLYNNYSEKRKEHHGLWEDGNYIGKRTCHIVCVNSHKLTAQGA